jgi:hypothetical protein
MYRYIIFIFVGILLFLHFNNNEQFIIGIPALYTKIVNGKKNCNIYYTLDDIPLHAVDNINLEGVPLNVIGNQILIRPGVYEDLLNQINQEDRDNPLLYYRGRIKDDGYIYIPIQREDTDGGLPGETIGNILFPGAGGRGGEDTGGGGGLSFGNVCSSIVNVFSCFRQLDLSRTDDSSTLQEALVQQEQEVTILEPTKEVLEREFGYNMGQPLIVDGDFKLFNVRVTDLRLDHEKMELLQSIFRNKGDIVPHYATSKNIMRDKLYFLTVNENGIDIVVSRILISINQFAYNILDEFTSYPSQLGRGSKMLELLSRLRIENPSLNIQINHINILKRFEYDPAFLRLRVFYRKMLRKSVELWSKKPEENFSIFLPIYNIEYQDPAHPNMLQTLYFFRESMYFDYDSLFYEIYQDLDAYDTENRKKYNHFLMQLNEDTITGTLQSLNPRTIGDFIESEYNTFLISHYS